MFQLEWVGDETVKHQTVKIIMTILFSDKLPMFFKIYYFRTQYGSNLCVSLYGHWLQPLQCMATQKIVGQEYSTLWKLLKSTYPPRWILQFIQNI